MVSADRKPVISYLWTSGDFAPTADIVTLARWLRTRRREYGVYAGEVLAVYAQFAMGVIANIGNG
jgi:hypothetical protein